MPHIFIDGRRIEAENGATVLQTALENGIDIPHFCWHPELSVSGNCRMCLVEIGMPRRLPDGSFETDDEGKTIVNYFPKLQIACATYVSDGMNVRTSSEKTLHAREAVMEFLLINHPLDCPICDEAGECKLQDYAFNHSMGESRFEEMKNRAGKRQVWGPNVMYDAERCISCSRCIRYAQEVAKQDVLTFVQRGDHVTIKLAEGAKWDNPYSMNVIEICPVGALTSTDFRFKSRVWDMSFNNSISFADSTGSNIKIGVRNNEILRIQPRTNMSVNKYWLSDDARLNHFKFVNENRITKPLIKIGGKQSEVGWEEAFDFVADKLSGFKPSEIMVLGSAKASNEDNYLLKKFTHKILKTPHLDYLSHIDNSFLDDFFLSVSDRAPNSAGAQEIGINNNDGSYKAKDLPDLIESGKIRALYVMEEDFKYNEHLIECLDDLEFLAVHYYNNTSVTSKADVVFAASTYAEIEGTYINKDNRVQVLRPAIVTKENVGRMGMKMSRLDKFGASNDRWTHHELRDCKQSWKIIQGLARKMGADWNYKNSQVVFEEMTNSIASFKGMSYAKIEEFLGLVLNKGAENPKTVYNYESHKMKPY